MNSAATATRLTWTSRATRLYRIYDSTGLETWTPSPLDLIAPDPGASTTRSTPHTVGPRRFFRVESLLPLHL